MGCPDYYMLCDGRQFMDFSEEDLVPILAEGGLPAWDIHCLISAFEHLFRLGAKENESETDAQSFGFWFRQGCWNGGERGVAICKCLCMVLSEREKVGR